jgi:predicted N-acetyltransferase YhbS
VVGVVHPESRDDEVYVQAAAGDREVREVLVDWLDDHLGRERDGRLVHGVFADDDDEGLRLVLGERGYRPTDRGERQAWRSLVDPLPDRPVPPGYRLASLADDNDLERLDRVLWRGFDHPGASPGWQANGRDRAQATPNYRLDRNVVVVAPSGEFVAFAGIWVVPENRVAYVEPVATDPDHRRLGLGGAAVTEALRRARDAGAREAWVGSDLAFYRTLGFTVQARSTLWERATP